MVNVNCPLLVWSGPLPLCCGLPALPGDFLPALPGRPALPGDLPALPGDFFPALRGRLIFTIVRARRVRVCCASASARHASLAVSSVLAALCRAFCHLLSPSLLASLVSPPMSRWQGAAVSLICAATASRARASQLTLRGTGSRVEMNGARPKDSLTGPQGCRHACFGRAHAVLGCTA